LLTGFDSEKSKLDFHWSLPGLRPR
jgi:hypothetical protein